MFFFREKIVTYAVVNEKKLFSLIGFKSEWATVKNHQLYVGGLGKEWTTAKGEVIHLNPQWIKVISLTGEVQHVDWHSNYEKMKEAANIHSPGKFGNAFVPKARSLTSL